jgi:hypothetical protein
MNLSYALTAVEEKALKVVMADPQEWFANFVQHRARIAINEIYEQEVARLKLDPNIQSISVNVEEVVMAAQIPEASAAALTPPPNPITPV